MDIDQKRDMAEHAKKIIEDKAFQWAVLKLRQTWFQELLENGAGDLTGARLCARINALEAIATELSLLISNYKADLKNARGN